MNYIVIERFADLQDGKRIYEPGESYPRLGLVVTRERIAYLAGSDNRIGYPLIKPEMPAEAPDKIGEESTAPKAKPAKKAARSPKKG